MVRCAEPHNGRRLDGDAAGRRAGSVHNGPGESLSDVYDRVQQAIDQAVPLMESGHSVLFVAHAHVLRILTARWLGVDPHFARLLRLDTAHYSILSVYKGDRVIERWNC